MAKAIRLKGADILKDSPDKVLAAFKEQSTYSVNDGPYKKNGWLPKAFLYKGTIYIPWRSANSRLDVPEGNAHIDDLVAQLSKTDSKELKMFETVHAYRSAQHVRNRLLQTRNKIRLYRKLKTWKISIEDDQIKLTNVDRVMPHFKIIGWQEAAEYLCDRTQADIFGRRSLIDALGDGNPKNSPGKFKVKNPNIKGYLVTFNVGANLYVLESSLDPYVTYFNNKEISGV